MTTEKLNRSEPSYFVVRLVILAHAIIAVPLAYFLNVWVDEASTLYTTGQGIGFALRNTLADEKQAPLYFWMMSVLRSVEGSVFFARLFSVACSVIAIQLFFDIARRFVSQRKADLATLLFGLHPFLFWAALEIRVYALVILLSLVLMKFWFTVFFDPEDDIVPKSGVGIFLFVAIVSLYTNYYLGFLLFALFGALIVTGRFRAARDYLIAMLIAGVVFAPLIWAMRDQFAANTVAFQTERSLATGLRLMWNTFLTFSLPTEIFPLEQISTISLIRVWMVRMGLIAVVVFAIRMRKTIFDDRLLALATVVSSITACFLFAYMLLGEVYVAVRHASMLFAPFALLLVLFLARAMPSWIWPAILVLYLGLFGYSLTALYPSMAKRGDWARVSEYLMNSEKPNQPIVVFTTFDALALPVHYKGINRILPDERFFDWEIEAPIGTPAAWKRQTEFVISEIPPEADEIWLLTNEKCDIGESCGPLEKFVRENYTIVDERSFYLEKVRLLRKKK